MSKASIDEAEYQEFVKTLPEDLRNEHFKWLKSVYIVPKALFLIKKLNLATITIDVQAWAKGLGMAYPRDEEGDDINIITGVCDKDAMQPNINPAIPIIIVEHTWKNKGRSETSPLLIDGNKRLRRGFLDGLTKMQAYFLPKQIAKLVRY